MAPAEEQSVGVILFRITTIEGSLKEMREEMRGGFASLAFVSKEVYAANQATAQDFARETRQIAEHARTIAMATLTFVIVATGAMLALIKAVAG